MEDKECLAIINKELCRDNTVDSIFYASSYMYDGLISLPSTQEIVKLVRRT